MHRAHCILYLWVGILGACRPEVPDYRGANLGVDSRPVDDLVAIYRATLGGSFRLDDPTLWILGDPTYLPRTQGLAGGDSIPADVLSALRSAGIVKGTCRMPTAAAKTPLVCPAQRAGYLVRFSEPFKLGADQVQVHLVVQQYAIPGGRIEQHLRFERAYYVAKDGGKWKAVREARLPQP
jgi:hypothetical protein